MKRTLSKIKIVDWILIIVSCLSLIFFAIIFFRKSTYLEVTVKVGDETVYYNDWLTGSLYWNDTSGTKPWFASLINKGMQEKDGLGAIQAEILDVFSYDKAPTRKSVYMNVRLKTVYNRASNSYTYKGVPVLAGSKLKLNLQNIHTEVLIVDTENNSKLTEKIVVESQLKEENQTYSESSGVDSYLADAIKIGDIVTDNKGNELIKVIDKKVTPARKSIITADGRMISGLEPTKKDISLTLELNVKKIDGKYFFLDDVPVLIGQIIPINTTTISIFPTITKFSSKK